MEYNYQKSRKHTIGKLVVMSLATLLPIILVGVFGSIYDFFKGNQALDLKIFRYIVFIILETFIIIKITFYIRVIVSKDWAEQYYIKKRDERNIYIRQRTNSFTIKLLLFLEAVGMVSAGFFSKQIFYCLCAILVATLLIYLFTYLYFSKKI